MLSARSRVCPTCHSTLLPDPPAAPVCPTCEAVAVPHHETWPRALKLWMLSELGRRRFAAGTARTEQQDWEKLLRDTFLAEGKSAQHYEVFVTNITSTLDLFSVATRRARDWEADGSPLAEFLDHHTRIAS